MTASFRPCSGCSTLRNSNTVNRKYIPGLDADFVVVTCRRKNGAEKNHIFHRCCADQLKVSARCTAYGGKLRDRFSPPADTQCSGKIVSVVAHNGLFPIPEIRKSESLSG